MTAMTIVKAIMPNTPAITVLSCVSVSARPQV